MPVSSGRRSPAFFGFFVDGGVYGSTLGPDDLPDLDEAFAVSPKVFCARASIAIDARNRSSIDFRLDVRFVAGEASN